MSHSLKILGLGLGASETKIKIHYRQLAHKYHPDKNDHAATGLTTEEATEFFRKSIGYCVYYKTHEDFLAKPRNLMNIHEKRETIPPVYNK
jgi:preprotein translocase subunit Sec63